MNNGAPDCSIILAAGKGTRMGSATTPKVCFPVNGVPAVCRALETYRACGIAQHILIVGSLAGKVVETVGDIQLSVPDFSTTAITFLPLRTGTK